MYQIDQFEFQSRVIDYIIYYYEKEFHKEIDPDAIVFPWLSKTLGNHKCTASYIDKEGVLPLRSIYFEFTYNGNTGELYVDIYSKVGHEVVSII